MQLFLTGVLPFLAHNHPSAAAFLTCRHHNFHASIIPEFLSDEDRVKSFCEARQKNRLKADRGKQYRNLYNLLVQTPLMQFSPSLIVFHKDCAELVLKQLLQTKYFTRTLQRCTIRLQLSSQPISNELVQALSKVQSLTKLNLRWCKVENQHLEIIINSFPSLETLTIHNSIKLRLPVNIDSPPPPAATKTLRSLTMEGVKALFAIDFIPHFTNLRKLELCGKDASQELDLLPLSSSLPHLTDLDLKNFILKNTESLKNLSYLATLRFHRCDVPELSFLDQENSLPHLTKILINDCLGLSTSSFASLSRAPNLHVLEIVSENFDNVCLQYLEDMVHLRKLILNDSNIVGDGRSLKTLMQNLFQLEELNLQRCRDMGNQGAIAGALYSTHSRLRVLNLRCCDLVDDDLNGIGKLNNTLEVLDLSSNCELTTEGLVHCKDLVKLKYLKLQHSEGITDLSPLKDCLNLEDLDVSICPRLTDDSFKVFSEEPNSFPNLRLLDLWYCRRLTQKAFEHLSKNNHLVYQLKKLSVTQMSEVIPTSSSARNNIYQLKGLRRLTGFFAGVELDSDRTKLEDELMQRLKNLEELE